VIAEGDILALCIRLFSQLLQGLYQVEIPKANSLLSRRASQYLSNHSNTLRGIAEGHRSDEFNRMLLPKAEETIAAIGYALAYDAAVRAGVEKSLLDIFVGSIIRLDPTWFLCEGGFSTAEDIDRFEDQAISAAVPHLDRYIESLGVNRFVTSPLATEDGWTHYLPSLPKFEGQAIAKL
jgi:hypothetical protein